MSRTKTKSRPNARVKPKQLQEPAHVAGMRMLEGLSLDDQITILHALNEHLNLKLEAKPNPDRACWLPISTESEYDLTPEEMERAVEAFHWLNEGTHYGFFRILTRVMELIEHDSLGGNDSAGFLAPIMWRLPANTTTPDAKITPSSSLPPDAP